MAWKKRKPVDKSSRAFHLQNIATVAARYPDFDTTTRWALEVAFLDAGYLYEQGEDHAMPDNVWDELGAYLARTWKKRSPFFQQGIDRRVLRKKSTNLAIDFGRGIGLATAEFWSTNDEPVKADPTPRRPVKKKPKGLKKAPKRRIVKLRKPA